MRKSRRLSMHSYFRRESDYHTTSRYIRNEKKTIQKKRNCLKTLHMKSGYVDK